MKRCELPTNFREPDGSLTQAFAGAMIGAMLCRLAGEGPCWSLTSMYSMS
jgi:hypothetical protein